MLERPQVRQLGAGHKTNLRQTPLQHPRFLRIALALSTLPATLIITHVMLLIPEYPACPMHVFAPE